MKIGMIGLGHMGSPMAKNLLKAGFDLTVFDINQHAVHELVELGASAVDSPNEFSSQKIIITMLQTGAQVQSVCLGEEGFYSQLSPGSLHIDCSSIDVDTAKALHLEAKKQKLLSLDSPVSGGVMGAEKGQLTFMIGGEEHAFALAQPILTPLAKVMVHTGAAGTGQAAKICNNMILGISMAAVSEAFVLGEKLGLASSKLFEVASQSSGQCWAMTAYCPVPGIVKGVPSDNDYQAGFSANMMLKDLLLSQTATESVDYTTPLGALARELYQQYVDSGMGEKDFSGIIQMLEQYKGAKDEQ